LPPGFVKSFLYGLERCNPAKLLILVESAWAVPFLYQRGFQAAALLGSSLTDAQKPTLAPFRDICVCMDNDEPGRAAAQKIANALRGHHRVHKAFLLG